MNEVAQPSPEVEKMRPHWDLAAALMGGTCAMREAGVTYMPPFPKEDPNDYKRRIDCATLFPAYSRTVKTLTGKPFSKPITVGDDVPTVITPWLEDVDLEGRNLDVFAANIMEDALAYGLCGILIDFPVAGDAKTKADELAQGLRPYWVHIKAHQLLGWSARRVNGRWTIEQLRIKECVTEPVTEFTEKVIEQVKVFTPGAWRIYRKSENQNKVEWVLHEKIETTLNYVPFVPVYGERTGFMNSKPPLLEMAYLNVKHWQSQSDQDNILHVARVPILAATGVDDDWSMAIGSSNAVSLPLGATLSFTEHSGKGIGAGRESLQDLEESMRQSGAELLVIRQTQTTATEIASDNAVGMCALQKITKDVQDALDQALQITADWVSAGEGGHVKIFDEFASKTFADASAQIVLTAQQSGLISKQTALRELQRRGELAADIDPEEELDSVEGEGPSLGEM